MKYVCKRCGTSVVAETFQLGWAYVPDLHLLCPKCYDGYAALRKAEEQKTFRLLAAYVMNGGPQNEAPL